ncbi:hypothetical protein VTI74DRAFT_8826 [Chaetomium olivicolor]
MMSLFPGSFCAPATDVSFVPLFRLLEDFDNYSRESQSQNAPASRNRRQGARKPRTQLATFTPHFDVRETEDTYELHGELPGLEKENVNIEFTEPQTIVIRGRVERSYGPEPDRTAASTEPAAAGSTQTDTEPEKRRRNSHQATVEDDPEDENTPASTPAATPKTDVVKPATQEVAQTQGQTQPEPRYWLWERSVGEFNRAFSFPGRVDHDGVTASLNNGILSITVPKAKKPVVRRIAIGA